jgi:hypothetical protein
LRQQASTEERAKHAKELKKFGRVSSDARVSRAHQKNLSNLDGNSAPMNQLQSSKTDAELV